MPYTLIQYQDDPSRPQLTTGLEVISK